MARWIFSRKIKVCGLADLRNFTTTFFIFRKTIYENIIPDYPDFNFNIDFL